MSNPGESNARFNWALPADAAKAPIDERKQRRHHRRMLGLAALATSVVTVPASILGTLHYADRQRNIAADRAQAAVVMNNTPTLIGDLVIQRQRPESEAADKDSSYDHDTSDIRTDAETGEEVKEPKVGQVINREVQYGVADALDARGNSVSYAITVKTKGDIRHIGAANATEVNVDVACLDAFRPDSSCADIAASYIFKRPPLDGNDSTVPSAADAPPTASPDWTMFIQRAGQSSPHQVGPDLASVMPAIDEVSRQVENAFRY